MGESFALIECSDNKRILLDFGTEYDMDNRKKSYESILAEMGSNSRVVKVAYDNLITDILNGNIPIETVEINEYNY